jgi:hypothetical protein
MIEQILHDIKVNSSIYCFALQRHLTVNYRMEKRFCCFIQKIFLFKLAGKKEQGIQRNRISELMR